MKRVLRHWPLLLGAVLLGGVVAVLGGRAWQQTGGHFVYACDDAYIHLTMARNLVQYGVLGVTPYEFTPASSSPLWTLLLVILNLLFGPAEWFPLLLNLGAALAIVGLCYGLLTHYDVPALGTALVLLLIVLVTPLPLFIFFGMEHTLHILLTLAFIYQAVRTLSGAPTGDQVRLRSRALLVLLAVLLGSVRYEGLLLVGGVVLLCAAQRRWWLAFLLGGSSVVPACAYGLVSLAHGWSFIPSSIVVKKASLFGPAPGAVFSIAAEFLETPLLLFLVLGALALLPARYSAKGAAKWPEQRVLLLLFVLVALLHMVFSTAYVRYTAYLLTLGLFVLAVAGRTLFYHWPQFVQGKLAHQYTAGALLVLLAAPVLLAYPLGERAWTWLRDTPQALKNIYEQQYQMALFRGEYYPHEAVGLNDIGVVGYRARATPLVDLAGIAHQEVAQAIMQGQYGPALLDRIARQEQVRIAFVYTAGFPTVAVPSSWVEVGWWQIRDNVVCGNDVVTFYAVDPAQAGSLATQLTAFAQRLPPDVIWFVRPP